MWRERCRASKVEGVERREREAQRGTHKAGPWKLAPPPPGYTAGLEYSSSMPRLGIEYVLLSPARPGSAGPARVVASAAKQPPAVLAAGGGAGGRAPSARPRSAGASGRARAGGLGAQVHVVPHVVPAC